MEQSSVYLKRCTRQGGTLERERPQITGTLIQNNRQWIMRLLTLQNEDGGYSGEKPASNLDDGCSTWPGLYLLACIAEGIERSMHPAMKQAVMGMVDFHRKSQHASGLFVQAVTFDDKYNDGTYVWDKRPFSRHGDGYRRHPGHNDGRTRDAVEFLVGVADVLEIDTVGDISRASKVTRDLYDEHGGLYEDYDGDTYRSRGGSPIMVPRYARSHEIPDWSPRAVGWGGETLLMAGYIPSDPIIISMADWLLDCAVEAPDGLWWPHRVDQDMRPVYGTKIGTRTSIRSLAHDKSWTKAPREFLAMKEGD